MRRRQQIQETRNKMPAASVYLLENLHFLQFFENSLFFHFFIADSLPGSIIIGKSR